MSLFQKSVINNKIESIDDNDIKVEWDNFQSYKSIINNIKEQKDEEFQFDFLKMIFNDCLGYKISDVGVEQKKAITIKTEIDKIDNEIDQMVYELYSLTKEEIEIVENSQMMGKEWKLLLQ